MDDERLSEQGFDEPAGLEQRWISPRVEAIKHHEIRDVIEDRADWADEQHKFRDIADVPSPRYRQIFGVDVVSRNGSLREVVQQVVGEYLNRRHRQERQEDAGAEHAEHVAEIRTRAHLDIFGDVAEDFAALDHPVAEHRQALLEQDDVRRVLGDVDRAVHRYADVRGLQRRSIVDAVAEKSNDVALPVQGIDDCRLLRRRDLGEHSGRLGQACQFVRRKHRHLAAEHDAVHGQADFVADLPRNDVVVPGQDLHLHAARLQRRNRGGAGLLRGIEKRDVAQQGEVGLVGDGIRRLRWRHLLEGNRDHSKSVRVELRRRLHRRSEVALIEGPGLAVDRVVLASREHLFDSALADEDMNPVITPKNDRHPPPLEVERHLVDLLEPLLDLEAALEFDVLEDCDVEQVLEAGLVETVQIGVFEDAVRVAAPDIEVALENNAILRERAGLVRAQHVHGPEVLDRIEALDDDFPARHRHARPWRD